MSSYIGIGFISKWTTKNIFISNILKAFDHEISLLSFANRKNRERLYLLTIMYS